MGVEIDASTDGVKLNNERGGGGGNPAEEAQALMNGAYAVTAVLVPLFHCIGHRQVCVENCHLQDDCHVLLFLTCLRPVLSRRGPANPLCQVSGLLRGRRLDSEPRLHRGENNILRWSLLQ
jgi:hypothetical protein